MFSNLIKASVATILTPITIAVDIFKLPSTAYNNEHPFKTTSDMLGVVRKNIDEVLK